MKGKTAIWAGSGGTSTSRRGTLVGAPSGKGPGRGGEGQGFLLQGSLHGGFLRQMPGKGVRRVCSGRGPSMGVPSAGAPGGSSPASTV